MAGSQQQVATLRLVERALIEELIEQSESPGPTRGGGGFTACSPHLATIRPCGMARALAARFEPSLFNGAGWLPTLLAEAACYRVVVWTAMVTPPPAGC